MPTKPAIAKTISAATTKRLRRRGRGSADDPFAFVGACCWPSGMFRSSSSAREFKFEDGFSLFDVASGSVVGLEPDVPFVARRKHESTPARNRGDATTDFGTHQPGKNGRELRSVVSGAGG